MAKMRHKKGIIPIILAVFWLSAGVGLAENDGTYLECRYGGLKSFYKTPVRFKIAHDGFAYDGDNKMHINRERVFNSYLFGSVINNNEMLMNSIDIFNGEWRQYTITKDEIMQIKNDEDVSKNKVNSYAQLVWELVGECKSVEE